MTIVFLNVCAALSLWRGCFTGNNFKHCWHWIEDCLLELANIFAIDIAAYVV